MTELFVFYLKFNVLLALIFIFWFSLVKGTDFLGVRQAPGSRLLHLRLIFIAVLALPLVISVLNIVGAQNFSSTVSGVLPGQLVVAGQAGNELGHEINIWWRGPDELLSVQALLAVTLVLGFIVQAARLSRQWLILRNIVRHGTRLRSLSALDIVFSEQTRTPFSTKVLGKNQIILPYSLTETPAVLRVAVKHELQHIRNGDLNWLLLLEALRLFCFWNPVVYFWQQHFDSLQEFACDDALTRRSGLSTSHYGKCLLEVATTAQKGEQRLLASSYMIPRLSFLKKNNSQLTRRIMMFTRQQKKRFGFLATLSSGLGLAVTLIASLSLYTNLSVAQGEVQEMPEYLPKITVPPRYPPRAVQQGIIGWVVVSFDLDKEGNVVDPYVVERCVVGESGACNSDNTLFDENTLIAVAKYKYGSAEEENRPEYVEGVMQRLRYCLVDDPGEPRSCQDRLREASLL